MADKRIHQLEEQQTITSDDYLPVDSVRNSATKKLKASYFATSTGISSLQNQISQLITELANYVPNTRTINSKALSSNISLNKSDIGLSNLDNVRQYSASNPPPAVFVPIANNASAHNAIYRGNLLGTSVTQAQWTAIKNGTFEDLYIGDYWTINNVNYRIAAFDYYLNMGSTKTTKHHIVIMPDTTLGNAAKMNNTDTVEGGYWNANIRGTGGALASVRNTINSAFNSSHILSINQFFTTATYEGAPSNGTYQSTTIEIPSSYVIFGSSAETFWSSDSVVYPLFLMNRSLIAVDHAYWTRNIALSRFGSVAIEGMSSLSNANANDVYIRPYFCIYSN